jgi:hypothetical protein
VQGLPAGEGRIECTHIFYDEDPGTSSFAAIRAFAMSNRGPPATVAEEESWDHPVIATHLKEQVLIGHS